MATNRPILNLDLSGPDGNVFVVINHTRLLLTGQMLDHFNIDISKALKLEAGKKYEDILTIVNSYVRLVDKSGTYAKYADEAAEKGMIDEKQVTAAIDHLNEQLTTLPHSTPCSLEGLYPDFENPECGPEIYLTLAEEEIKRIEEELEEQGESQVDSYQKLRSMLLECVTALHGAGVERRP